MIFLHLILGFILGKLFGHTLLFVVSSILPDIDHVYIIIKNKIWNLRKLIDSIKNEEKYHVHFKTPLMHSILGLILCSIVFSLMNQSSIKYFSLAYFLHLILDWPDIDKKYYLYPFSIEFKGFLSIWSKTEKVVTILSLLLLIGLDFFH